MSGFQFIAVEREGAVTRIILNRSEVMNAVHQEMHEELQVAFDAFEADPEQWVAIVTGAGERAFCAGSDLKRLAQTGRVVLPPGGYAGLTQRRMDKPVIAAVNGVAMGGGFEIALACDLIIASETATFALPEPKVGQAATAGGLLNLPRQIPLKQAMAIVLTGRKVTAQQALDMGFVNEVVPQAELAAAAARWAAEICACSPMSVRASKQIITRGLDEPTLSAAFEAQTSYPALIAMRASDDAKEGPRAFGEKRPPRWTGR